jgi:hypothetical protein
MAQGQVRATHGDAADAAVLSRLWQQQEIRVADDWWVVLTTARRRRVRSIGADGLIVACSCAAERPSLLCEIESFAPARSVYR